MEGYAYNKNSVLEKYDPTPTTGSTNLVDSDVVKTYVDGEITEIDAKVDSIINRVSNPFTFKGTVSLLANLPSSGNTVNDTYFVEGTGFMYTWNGTSWEKSSTDVNNQLARDIATEYDETKADYKQGQLVLYNNQIYVRKSDATSAEGTFIAANWTATSLGDNLYTEITNLKSALNKQDLFNSEIPNTTQAYTFSNGSVSQVVHSRNNVAVRTDTFTYGSSTITEVRTLSSGESLTIITNLTTLEIAVTYTAA